MTAQCDSGGFAWVPDNEYGHQYARTGNSYAQLESYVRYYSNARNYVQVALNKPLVGGIKYCVVFYVSLGDTCKWACNDMGAYFSDSALYNDPNNSVKSNFTPQIANDPVNNPLTDKVHWTRISGSFIANGGESYIVIGNFKDDAHSSIDSLGSKASSSMVDAKVASYYIDDVSVLAPIYSHAGRDTDICNGDKVLIGEDTAIPCVSYYWAPATGLSNANVAQPLASPMVTTTYTLTVVNDSMRGCNCPDSVSSSSKTIEVCQRNIFIPEAFSPNGDGQNDVLFAKGNNVNTFYMAIYDRWGNKIFESANINQGWDGTYKDKPEETGTYLYYANGTYLDGGSFSKKGNIALIR